MTQVWQESKPNCFVEFRVYDQERYDVLARFFKPLKTYTQLHQADIVAQQELDVYSSLPSANPSDVTQETFVAFHLDETQMHYTEFARPEQWLLSFRPQDLDLLGMPSHTDAIKAIKSWQGLSRRERRKAIKAQENTKQLRTVADFVDMLRYWQDIEYHLISLEQTDSDMGRITYSTYDFPFKGKVAIEELLIFFGFLSILKDSC